MWQDPRDAVVSRLADYDRLVEVGIGARPEVAAALAERVEAITATDVDHRATPAGVRFVRDDVTDPEPGVYDGADAVYALNCPPELHRPLCALADSAGADCLFTTLGGDFPAVPATPETLPGVTLYRAKRSALEGSP